MRPPLLLLLAVAACDKGPPCGIGADVDVQAELWFADQDEDGFGDPNDAVVACDTVSNRVQNAEDCNDVRHDVHPGAEDALCDGIDGDCDGLVDEDGARVWYFDQDGDGGGGLITTLACEQPEGFVDLSNDCDDDDPETHLGAVELCDDRDNDCDGVNDEVITARCYPDADRDGHGDDTPGVVRVMCGGTCGFTEATAGDDCDDHDAATWRGAPEACDGRDNDCEPGTWIDEGATCGTNTNPTIDPASGHVYLVIPSAVTWGGASASCASRGYHLAWIDDGVESTLLQTLFARDTDLESMWVGLRKDACGSGGAFERADTRYDPWRCSPMSAWEQASLDASGNNDSALLSSGGLTATVGIGVFTGAVCEVEP
ncbi:MAG TPA: MopE-related protein [Myxococcota bacterium]|nr:MopE-related protein [Myxococcota bacterium]